MPDLFFHETMTFNKNLEIIIELQNTFIKMFCIKYVLLFAKSLSALESAFLNINESFVFTKNGNK